MLRFVVTDKNGAELPELRALTVRIDLDVSVPADSLTVTCPFDEDIRAKADSIRAYCGEQTVFAGQLDNITVEKRSGGVLLVLNGRSLAAGLLDNEAEPVTYNNPSALLMESRHLLPFGIRLERKDNVPYYGALQIDKGMSHWKVLRSFCRNRYGCEPRVTGDGRAVLDGSREEGVLTFSDKGAGIPYYALTESCKRHCLLSEIRLKFRQTNAYSSVIRNPNPAAAAVRRVRFVNAAADKTTLATAEKMIEDSNRKAYVLRLRCKGCYAEAVGRRAEVEDSLLGKIGGLTAERVRYTVDSRGEQSEIVFKKERF